MNSKQPNKRPMYNLLCIFAMKNVSARRSRMFVPVATAFFPYGKLAEAANFLEHGNGRT